MEKEEKNMIIRQTSMESDKPWPGSPFGIIRTRTYARPSWKIKEDKGQSKW